MFPQKLQCPETMLCSVPYPKILLYANIHQCVKPFLRASQIADTSMDFLFFIFWGVAQVSVAVSERPLDIRNINRSFGEGGCPA